MTRRKKAGKKQKQLNPRKTHGCYLQSHDDVSTCDDVPYRPCTMQYKPRGVKGLSEKDISSVSWRTGIPFVSGGNMRLGDLEETTQVQDTGQVSGNDKIPTQAGVSCEDHQQSPDHFDMTMTPSGEPGLELPQEVVGPVVDPMEYPQIYDASGHSDSGDDQVIFKGRRFASNPLCNTPPLTTTRRQVGPTTVWTVPSKRGDNRKSLPHTPPNPSQTTWAAKFENIFSHGKNDEAEIAADYVAHIDLNDESSSSCSKGSVSHIRTNPVKTKEPSVALAFDLDRLENVHISERDFQCDDCVSTRRGNQRDRPVGASKPVPNFGDSSPSGSDRELPNAGDPCGYQNQEDLDSCHSSNDSLLECDIEATELLETMVDIGLRRLDPLDCQYSSFRNYEGNRKKASKSKGKDRQPPTEERFPSASAFADALELDTHGGFDIMDFERPSLRKRGKGRHQLPLFDAAYGDLQAHLAATFENDRKKKKQKRQEREERRAAGLLGKKAARLAAKSKDASPINLETLRVSIREFLLSSSECLSLQPMDKNQRQAIHEIANAITLKSQSRGSGSSRYPVLYKTGRTLKFDSTNIHVVDDAFTSRRVWRFRGPPRHDQFRNSHSGQRRNGGSLTASYLDGDIVGATAPELGSDNRGRAMLEKMGWTDGTALGAVDNKGILHPVAHMVRKTRAGLG